MKKFLLIPLLFLILVLTVTATYGQITTTKVNLKVKNIDNVPYDSTKNFLGKDVYGYVGQELYLNGKPESLRKYGYEGFSIDYTKVSFRNDTSNVYKCCDIYNSKHNELIGKYFTVLEVIKDPKAEQNKYEEYLYGEKFYLKLQEKEKKDIVFYDYNSESEYSFPFIVVSYFNKLKQSEIGKKYIVRGKSWVNSEPMTDMKTGNPLSNFKAGGKWKCVNVTIEEKDYRLSLVLENEKGEQILLPVDYSEKTKYNYVFEFRQAEFYKKKFGDENWQLILEGIVKIGMTKEMSELSWDKPKSINKTITSRNKSEQWVYSNNYLYFDNGILTTIQ